MWSLLLALALALPPESVSAYEAAIGEIVTVTTVHDGRFVGVLRAVSPTQVVVESGGEAVVVAADDLVAIVPNGVANGVAADGIAAANVRSHGDAVDIANADARADRAAASFWLSAGLGSLAGAVVVGAAATVAVQAARGEPPPTEQLAVVAVPMGLLAVIAGGSAWSAWSAHDTEREAREEAARLRRP